jgi:hypothetical protein
MRLLWLITVRIDDPNRADKSVHTRYPSGRGKAPLAGFLMEKPKS